MTSENIDAPTPGECFGGWFVTDAPVRVRVTVEVECEACGHRQYVTRERLRDQSRVRLKACPKCHHLSGRLDRGGESQTMRPIYALWRSMIHRAGPTAHEDTRRRYYDRGIRVCDEWMESWESFRDWCLENGHAKGMQLDRRDNDAGYSPDNCRFVTPKTNMRNTRATTAVTAWGETKSLSAWLEDPRCKAGHYHQVWDRLFRVRVPWDAERAISTPGRTWKIDGPYAKRKGA